MKRSWNEFDEIEDAKLRKYIPPDLLGMVPLDAINEILKWNEKEMKNWVNLRLSSPLLNVFLTKDYVIEKINWVVTIIQSKEFKAPPEYMQHAKNMTIHLKESDAPKWEFHNLLKHFINLESLVIKFNPLKFDFGSFDKKRKYPKLMKKFFPEKMENIKHLELIDITNDATIFLDYFPKIESIVIKFITEIGLNLYIYPIEGSSTLPKIKFVVYAVDSKATEDDIHDKDTDDDDVYFYEFEEIAEDFYCDDLTYEFINNSKLYDGGEISLIGQKYGTLTLVGLIVWFGLSKTIRHLILDRPDLVHWESSKNDTVITEITFKEGAIDEDFANPTHGYMKHLKKVTFHNNPSIKNSQLQTLKEFGVEIVHHEKPFLGTITLVKGEEIDNQRRKELDTLQRAGFRIVVADREKIESKIGTHVSSSVLSNQELEKLSLYDRKLNQYERKTQEILDTKDTFELFHEIDQLGIY
jgi:hypothetical protein